LEVPLAARSAIVHFSGDEFGRFCRSLLQLGFPSPNARPCRTGSRGCCPCRNRKRTTGRHTSLIAPCSRFSWRGTPFRLACAPTMFVLFSVGAFTWTLTEYAFHRWVYHLGFAVTREGHERHHDDPTAYIAMPWFVTPILF